MPDKRTIEYCECNHCVEIRLRIETFLLVGDDITKPQTFILW